MEKQQIPAALIAVLLFLLLLYGAQADSMDRTFEQARGYRQEVAQELAGITTPEPPTPPTLQLVAQPLTTQPAPFQPLDIPLAPELQEHTYTLCQQYGVPFEVALALMWTESGFIWTDGVVETNGYCSVGYMQINEPNWAWLQEEYSIDVHDHRDNIEAGIIILSTFLESHSLEKALVMYQCGEMGAAGINSTAYSRRVLEWSKAYGEDDIRAVHSE